MTESPTTGDHSLCAPTRRRFLRNTVSLAASSALAPVAPYVFSKEKITLRVMGTHVTLQPAIREQAMRDLGIDIIFEPGGEAELVQKATTQPDAFDLYEQWTDSIRQLWQANAIRAIDVDRLTYWSEINQISRTGKPNPSARLGLGDAPHKILNVQPDGSLGELFTGQISFLPYVHNVDSFGYNTRVVERGVPYETESWAWLLDERWRGQVGIVNSPTIGIFDLALAAQAKGLVTFSDMGNMSVAELDQLFNVLVEFKRAGQFSGFWNSVPQSVEFMTSGRVVIESMFSPGVSSANGAGVPVIYAAPKEGYRAWHGVMCLSKACTGYREEAAYEYMNWWLSGWAGAFIARQGYYISNPERSRELMDANEWDYWYEGKETASALRGTDGKISVAAGDIRTGGSYERRFSNVAIWNTVMPNYDYSLQRWYEFLLA